MQNPTEQECRQLAERWPEDFRWANGNRLDFNVGQSAIAYWIGQRWITVDAVYFTRDVEIDPALGQAALTAKCKEVAEPYLLTENVAADGESVEWQVCDRAPYLPVRYVGDTPWAALLATETSPEGQAR